MQGTVVSDSVDCAVGLVKSWRDKATEAVSTAEELWTNAVQFPDFAKTCDADITLQCRRKLAGQAGLDHLSDAELKGLSTMQLTAIARNAPPKSRSVASHSVDQQTLRALTGAATGKLKDLGVMLKCYDRRTQVQLLCHGIGAVVDPAKGLPKLLRLTATATKIGISAQRRFGQ